MGFLSLNWSLQLFSPTGVKEDKLFGWEVNTQITHLLPLVSITGQTRI